MREKEKEMKWFVFLIPIFFIGCGDIRSTSSEYVEFVKKYGSNTRYYCDETGFLVMEFYMYSNDLVASRRLVKNDSDTPTRCGSATINVKETVATGVFSGSVK